MASESNTGKERGEGFLILKRDDATLCVVVNRIGPRVPECDAAALVLGSLRTTFASGGSVGETFAAISNANSEVVSLSDAAKRRDAGVDIRWHGMGATVDVVFFASDRAHLAGC